MAVRREPVDPAPELSAERLRAEVETGFAGFERELAASFPPLTDRQAEQIGKFLQILLFWRTRLSLISVGDPLQIVREHVIDSLALIPWTKPEMRVADLGSGGGFPGIPLAVCQPVARFSLIESRRKRANFLREAVRQLGLDNTEVVEERAEQLQSQASMRFDLLIARAFGSIAELLNVAKPLMRPGGLVVAMKGERSVQQAAEVPGAANICSYTLPGGIPRNLVIYQI